MRARSALFTLFGDVVRPAGGEAWLSTLTACMGTLGFSPEATRTALHRMSAEGWVEPRKEGRYAAYRLTPRGVDRLEEAAARIYRLRAADWDGRWRLLLLPTAPTGELERALRWMGFGRVGGPLWASPHDHGERLDSLLAQHAVAESTRFVTDPADSDAARDRRLVDEAWDLTQLRHEHAAFIERWRGRRGPRQPEPAFRTRVRLVHDWRSFLFLDPGLPGSLLPPDWLGDAAAECFAALYSSVEEAAWRYYDELGAASPGQAGAVRRDPQASPFALGLEALHSRRPDLVGGAP